MRSAAGKPSPPLTFHKSPLSPRAHDPLANKIPAHLKCLVSPVHLLLVPPLTSVLSVSAAQERKTLSVVKSSTPPSAFNQQSSIKFPRMGYVPGVAVMERQYSLTSSAIVFHINLGKNDLSTF